MRAHKSPHTTAWLLLLSKEIEVPVMNFHAPAPSFSISSSAVPPVVSSSKTGFTPPEEGFGLTAKALAKRTSTSWSPSRSPHTTSIAYLELSEMGVVVTAVKRPCPSFLRSRATTVQRVFGSMRTE